MQPIKPKHQRFSTRKQNAISCCLSVLLGQLQEKNSKITDMERSEYKVHCGCPQGKAISAIPSSDKT